MSEENQVEPLEVMPPSALLSIERASVDGQIATAHAYPRSLELFKKRAIQMVSIDPDTADSCIYVRPVGKEMNERGQWVEKYAEGPSIRLAEIVAVSYGNIRAYSRIVEQTDRFVRCEGFAHDLESNSAMKSECLESTVTKKGEPYSERQRALTAKVCLKKALRDAIFTTVPRALCKPIMDIAKKVATGAEKSLDERRKKARAWVGNLKIDEARVLTALGVNGWSEVMDEHLLTLTGLKTAMADGDETIDTAFPPLESKPQTRAPDHFGPPPSQTTTTTAPGTGQKQPVPTPKTSGDALEAQKGPKTPPEAPKPAVQPPAAGNEPPVASSDPEADEKALSEAGLAPEQPKEQGQTPETNATGEPDSFLAPTQWDSDACASVKLQAAKSGVSGAQLRDWLLKKKLIKPEQKFHEISAQKCEALNRNFVAKLPEIRAQK